MYVQTTEEGGRRVWDGDSSEGLTGVQRVVFWFSVWDVMRFQKASEREEGLTMSRGFELAFSLFKNIVNKFKKRNLRIYWSTWSIAPEIYVCGCGNLVLRFCFSLFLANWIIWPKGKKRTYVRKKLEVSKGPGWHWHDTTRLIVARHSTSIVLDGLGTDTNLDGHDTGTAQKILVLNFYF